MRPLLSPLLFNSPRCSTTKFVESFLHRIRSIVIFADNLILTIIAMDNICLGVAISAKTVFGANCADNVKLCLAFLTINLYSGDMSTGTVLIDNKRKEQGVNENRPH